jgi:hypothetical protein
MLVAYSGNVEVAVDLIGRARLQYFQDGDFGKLLATLQRASDEYCETPQACDFIIVVRNWRRSS